MNDDEAPAFIAFLQSAVVRHLLYALAAQIVLLVNTIHKIFAAGGLTADNVESALEAIIEIAGIGFTVYGLISRVIKPMPGIKLTQAAADQANAAAATTTTPQSK
jgi:hypothetical protein